MQYKVAVGASAGTGDTRCHLDPCKTPAQG